MRPQLVRRFWKNRYKFNMTPADYVSLLIVIVLGLFISSTTAYLVLNSQESSQKLELENRSYVYLSHAENTISKNVNMLYNIRGVFNASNFVDENEFNIFTSPILKANREIQALQWVPLIAHEMRQELELLGRKNGHEAYEIKERDGRGNMQKAKQRDVYFPVFYINPLENNEKAFGFDLASNVIQKAVLEKARDTGLAIATPPIELVHVEDKQLSFLILLAVYSTTEDSLSLQERRNQLQGFVLAVYRIKDIFNFSAERVKDPDLAVIVNDISEPKTSVEIFSSLPEKANRRSYGKHRNRDEKFTGYIKVVDVAGRKWQFIFHHIDDSKALFDLPTMLVFSIGLLFTAFISAYVLGNSRRRSIVEELIKERTQELEVVKNEIQQVLDNTGEGICGLDLEGKTTFVNQAALELTGYTKDEFLYRSQHSLIHHHYADGSVYPDEDCKIYETYRKGVKNTSDSEVFWHKDGSAIQIEYTATPMLDENNNIRGSVVIFHDIAQRKKHESELIEARNHAEQASLSKSTFLATMSHEIRTPMNGMLGMAQILSETELSKSQQECIDTLIKSGRFLLNQINDILDFSRIEAGKLKLEIDRFNLQKCCEYIVQLMRNKAEEKGLNFEFKYMDNCPKMVVGDEHRIQQIILNLVGNAIKFTSEGNVILYVMHEEIDEENANFTIQVVDSGIGLDKNKLDQLFDAFTQADASTTRKHGGSGLGLAISKQLANLMGGDIIVESAAGNGSVFELSINLPVSTDDDPGVAVDETEQLIFKGHILLVEDNLVNQKVASAMLKNIGLDVSVADNGRIALEKFNHEDFDLILMDCQMPVMDGYTATQAIRQMDKGKDIPVLALTANVLPEDIQHCMDSGMNDCLHKPIEKHVLENGLKPWLKFDINIIDRVEEGGTVEELTNYVDTQHLGGLATIMGEVFKELIPAYIEATDDFFNVAMETLERQDISTAERLAHSLKSSSRNVGATELGELAEKLENSLRANNVDDFKPVFEQAKEMYQHVRKELLAFKPEAG